MKKNKQNTCAIKLNVIPLRCKIKTRTSINNLTLKENDNNRQNIRLTRMGE